MATEAQIYAIGTCAIGILTLCIALFAMQYTQYEMRHTFMQNKPNLLAPQMNVSSVKTKDYDSEIVFRLQKNKPKQSQFQTQSEAEIPTVELL